MFVIYNENLDQFLHRSSLGTRWYRGLYDCVVFTVLSDAEDYLRTLPDTSRESCHIVRIEFV